MEEMHATSRELMRRIHEIERTSDEEWICAALDDDTVQFFEEDMDSHAAMALSVQEKKVLGDLCHGDGRLWTRFVNDLELSLRVLLQKHILLAWLQSSLRMAQAREAAGRHALPINVVFTVQEDKTSGQDR